jgi:UDP-N-acetylmuramoyl-L-alanyl-D-glutamate--2,6-diaminopimelate ligase
MSPAATLGRSPELKLCDLARELGGEVRTIGDSSVVVRGLQHDSRCVQVGDLFLARKGSNADGARFIPEAVARGASAVMVSEGAVPPEGLGIPALVVGALPSSFARAAHILYGHPSQSLEVVGVTGTNGKTTTAHLVGGAIDGVLTRSSCGVLGTIGHSFGAWHEEAKNTTPEADDIARAMFHMRRLGATHVAMEVSSHALELGRVEGVRFRVAALTNLTQDHLDFHGSMTAYARAKGRLFTELRPECAVLNIDDPLGRELAERLAVPLVRVSAQGADQTAAADLAVRQSHLGADGIRAAIRTPVGDVTIESRLIGAHNLDNLLLSLGIAYALGLDVERAAHALGQQPSPAGRLERCDEPEDTVTVLVDYAHTPDALARTLEAVRPITRGRVWCVFGCGGDRDPAKRSEMGEAAARRADTVVITSDNPRSEDPAAIASAIAQGVRRAGSEPLVELDRAKAIVRVVSAASPGDVVLVAGKGHEDHQIIGAAALPFDDRVEARRALARRRRGAGGI